MSKPVRIFILIALVAISIVPTMEIALRIVDPWGLKYFDDLAILWDRVTVHPQRGYALPPGTYQFSHWKATVNADSTRWLPGNQGGACRVVFLGDSVTWSHGVNDDETWVNVLVSQLPEVSAINAALNGYNSENVRRAAAEFPDAHVIIYLIVGNDMEPTMGWEQGWVRQPHLWMIDKYMRYWQLSRSFPTSAAPAPSDSNTSNTAPDPHRQRFEDDIRAMAGDPRFLLLAIPGFLDPAFIAAHDIYELPPGDGRGRISAADPHPNAEGSQRMAAALLPIVQGALATRCPA